MAQPRVVPFSLDETQEIFSAQPPGVLIGGQALAFWAQYYGVEPPSALEAGVTVDIDFFGTKEDAKKFASRLLQTVNCEIEVFIPDFDDFTPNAAKVVLRGFHGRADPVEIDYLGSLHGFTSESERRLKRRSVAIQDKQVTVRVMHPVDCLVSRVKNLDSLPGKRNKISVAQCRLAVKVVHEHLREICAAGTSSQRSKGYRIVEQVGVLARSAAGARIWIKHGLNILNAVPADEFASEHFQNKRWPTITRLAKNSKKREQRRRERSKKLRA